MKTTTNTAKPLGSLARELDLAQDRDYLRTEPTAEDIAWAKSQAARDAAWAAADAADEATPFTPSDTLDPLAVLFPGALAE